MELNILNFIVFKLIIKKNIRFAHVSGGLITLDVITSHSNTNYTLKGIMVCPSTCNFFHSFILQADGVQPEEKTKRCYN